MQNTAFQHSICRVLESKRPYSIKRPNTLVCIQKVVSTDKEYTSEDNEQNILST